MWKFGEMLIFVFATILAFAASANAGCEETGKSGWMYVWATCTETVSDNPQNTCEVTEDSKNRLFYTDIVFDTPNGKFPSEAFWETMYKDHGIHLTGTDSKCFLTKGDAKWDRDEFVADHLRRYYNTTGVSLSDD